MACLTVPGNRVSIRWTVCPSGDIILQQTFVQVNIFFQKSFLLSESADSRKPVSVIINGKNSTSEHNNHTLMINCKYY